VAFCQPCHPIVTPLDTFLRKYKDEKSYTASGSAVTNKVMTEIL